jgi:hypothetical protein
VCQFVSSGSPNLKLGLRDDHLFSCVGRVIPFIGFQSMEDYIDDADLEAARGPLEARSQQTLRGRNLDSCFCVTPRLIVCVVLLNVEKYNLL